MKLKIFGFFLGIIAVSSISSAKAQSSEIFTQIDENNKIIQMQAQNRDNSQQQPPLIDRKIFFGDPEISGAQLSPDGKYLAFRKPLNGVINIWVKGIDEPMSAARPITEDKNRPIPAYFWSQDSQYILFVQDKGGNENFRIYAVSPTDKVAKGQVPKAKDLTPDDQVRAIIYAVPENNPDTIIVGLNDRDPKFHDVYSINIATGARKLLYKNDSNVSNWVTDLNGNLRLAVINLPDGSTQINRIEADSFEEVYRCQFGETCSPVRFHKNGKQVYMSTNKGNDVDLSQLVLFNPQTKKLELVDSDPEKQVDFGSPIFSEETEELIGTVYIGDKQRIYPKDKEFAADLAYLKEKLPDGQLGMSSMTEDGQKMIVTVSSDIDPGSAYLFNRQTKKLSLLYQILPELKRENLAKMTPIRYTARDGLEIPAYLTLPVGKPARNLPVVVMPHGGPWARDVWGYNPYTQFLANRGYAVFQPNFRASTGYGKKFLNAGNKQWGTGAMQHDITDGVKYLIDQGIADPKRVGIFGGSYGGYATLAGLAFTPELYAAGVSYVGPSNLITLFNSVPPYWESFKAELKLRMGDPNTPEGKKQLQQQSPLFSADKMKSPLLVIQGANDPRVKQAESDQIVAALRTKEIDVDYLLAPDEGHGFRQETNKLAVAAALEKFFAEHLQGRYQEAVAPEVKKQLDDLTVDISKVQVSK
ncbi:dipeptidyl aminopeptidase/acylaminoacyl peptidase [Rivularia sp. PCC 7116]|uniref:S9 family peptidase n=1 Tax=Rivularia sp. PCC 7116 TaxID=373994 RepID=UPI00029F17CA|nr:S9 family peptidase [Rivularia sp. PCC 7116]AFY54606.1 dipeptidyl aminopeptidase/acylaminoacyl peptidase [Rivularia sp. PCC 7116]